MAPGNGVDLIIAPGKPFPIEDSSVDVVVTSSALEHDVCFWETFLELMRILTPGGLLYINAPSNYAFHRYPVDCWRFYPDAGNALQVWASRRGITVELLESFVAKPTEHGWADFVAVFRKASDRPYERRGRLADRTTAMNIYDVGRSDPMQLEAENPMTWDMMKATELAQRLDRCGADLAGSRRELAATKADLDAAKTELDTVRAQMAVLDERAARLAAERDADAREIQDIKASTVWRLLAVVRRLSQR